MPSAQFDSMLTQRNKSRYSSLVSWIDLLYVPLEHCHRYRCSRKLNDLTYSLFLKKQISELQPGIDLVSALDVYVRLRSTSQVDSESRASLRNCLKKLYGFERFAESVVIWRWSEGRPGISLRYGRQCFIIINAMLIHRNLRSTIIQTDYCLNWLNRYPRSP